MYGFFGASVNSLFARELGDSTLALGREYLLRAISLVHQHFPFLKVNWGMEWRMGAGQIVGRKTGRLAWRSALHAPLSLLTGIVGTGDLRGYGQHLCGVPGGVERRAGQPACQGRVDAYGQRRVAATCAGQQKPPSRIYDSFT